MANPPGGAFVPGRTSRPVLDLDSLVDPTRCPGCGTVLGSSTCSGCGADLAGPDARRVWDLSQQLVSLAAERADAVAVLRRAAEHRRAAPVPPTLPARATPPTATTPTPGAATAHGPRLGVQGVLVGLGALLLAVAAVVFLVVSWSALGIGGRAAVVAGVTVAALAGAAALRPRLEATAEAVGALAAVLVLADVWAVRRTDLLGAGSVETLTYTGAGLGVAAVLLGAWGLRWRVRAGSVVASGLAPLAALLLGLTAGGPRPGVTDAGLGLLAAAAVAAARRVLPGRLGAERVLLRLAAGWALAVLPCVVLLVWVSGGRGSALALAAAGAGVAGLQSAVDDRRAPRIAAAWSALGGADLAGAAVVAAAWLLDATQASSSWAVLGPVAAAAATVPALGAAAPAARRARVHPRAAAVAALAVTALLLLADVLVVTVAVSTPVVAAVTRPWQARFADPLASLAIVSPEAGRTGTDLLAACAALLLVAAALVATHRLRPEVVRAEAVWSAPLLAGAAVGLLAAPTLMVGATVLGLAVLAATTTAVRVRYPALGAIGRPATARRGAPVEVVLRFVAGGTGVLAVLSAWNVPALSVPLTGVGALALLAARPALPRAAGPALVGSAAVAAAVAAGGAAGLLGRSPADRFTVAGLAGCLVVAAAAALGRPAGRVHVADDGHRGLLGRPDPGERLAAWIAGATVTAVAVLVAVGPVVAVDPLLAVDAAQGAIAGEPGRLALLLAALLGALVVTAVAPVSAATATAAPTPGAAVAPARASHAVRALRGVRLSAAGAVPGVAAAVAVALVERFTPPSREPVAATLVVASVVAVAALALAALVGLRPPTARDPRRPPVEVSCGLVAMLALALLLAGSRAGRADRAWVVLMLLGVAAAALATAPDRRRLGWLAWVLLTGSSWVRLALADVSTLEAYTLPPATALLVVAALRVRREHGAHAWRALAPGAGLALVPSILATTAGGDLRPALLLAVGAALVVTGLLGEGGTARARTPYLVGGVLCVTGAATAAGTGLLRPGASVLDAVDRAVGGPAAEAYLAPARLVERWSVPAAAVVLAAALVLALRHRALLARARGLALVPALVVLAGPTWLAAAAAGTGPARLAAGGPATAPTAVRLLAASAVLAATALAAAALPLVRPGALDDVPGPGPGPAARLLTWPVALAAAAGSGLVAATAHAVLDVPVEAASAPFALLAVALGGLRMARVPSLGSWRALGGGLALLLVPTLLLAAGGALWRVLGLVVVAGPVVAVGALCRLSAPVVLGGLVLATHAVAQLAPYVAALTSSPWRWVVFAVVGAGLLVLGATWERRLGQLRTVRTRIAALR